MPFVRLISIYFAVFVVAFLIFNREGLMQMFSTDEDLPPLPPIPVASAPAVSTPAPATPDPATEPVAEETADTEVLVIPVAETSEPLAEPAPEAAQSEAAAPASMEDRLAEARKVYWSGDVAAAEVAYIALAADFPNEADIKGELGNLYYSSGKYTEAADYFHQAGKLLMADGKTQQAVSLVGVLQAIAPEKAADLRAMAAQQ